MKTKIYFGWGVLFGLFAGFINQSLNLSKYDLLFVAMAVIGIMLMELIFNK